MKTKVLIFSLIVLAMCSCKNNKLSFSIPVADGVSRETFTFAIKGTDTLKLDVFRDTTEIKARPTVIYSFGGGWRTGNRESAIFASRFVKKGYNVVTIDYRKSITDKSTLTDSVTFAANYGNAVRLAVEDLFDATSYLIEHSQELGIDPAAIIASGSSAGAINSVTGEYLICNSDTLALNHLPAGFNYAGVIAYAGAVWKDGMEDPVWQKQPCPHMFLHGTDDDTVDYNRMLIHQSDFAGFGPAAISAIFRENGWQYETFTVEGSDHYQCLGPDIRMFLPCEKPDYTRHVLDFIDRMVVQKAPVQIEYTEKTLDGARIWKNLKKSMAKVYLSPHLRKQVLRLPQFGSGELDKQTFDFAVKDGDTLRLDVYRDKGFTGPRPVFIYSFGGGWEGGIREHMATKVYPFAQEMAAKGYVAVLYDYRLGYRMARNNGSVPDVSITDHMVTGANMSPEVYAAIDNAVKMAVEDTYDATSFVVAHAQEWEIDPSKIIIGGGSAGAFNSITAEYWNCNGDPLAKEHLPAGFRYAGIVPCAGAIWHRTDEPLHWDTKPAPILMFHGDSDIVVPYIEKVHPEIGISCTGGLEIARSLEEIGATFCLYTGIGQSHEMAGTPTPYIGEFIGAFLDRTVFNGEQIQARATEKWTTPDYSMAYYLQHSQRYPFQEVLFDYFEYFEHAYD